MRTWKEVPFGSGYYLAVHGQRFCPRFLDFASEEDAKIFLEEMYNDEENIKSSYVQENKLLKDIADEILEDEEEGEEEEPSIEDFTIMRS
jgi:hypothetical protein